MSENMQTKNHICIIRASKFSVNLCWHPLALQSIWQNNHKQNTKNLLSVGICTHGNAKMVFAHCTNNTHVEDIDKMVDWCTHWVGAYKFAHYDIREWSWIIWWGCGCVERAWIKKKTQLRGVCMWEGGGSCIIQTSKHSWEGCFS